MLEYFFITFIFVFSLTYFALILLDICSIYKKINWVINLRFSLLSAIIAGVIVSIILYIKTTTL